MPQCLITGLNAENWEDSESVLTYSLSYNSQNYQFRFSKGVAWRSFLTKERKFLLQAWLWNKEWPFAPEILLSEELVDRAIRQIPNPTGDFYLKLDYFLLRFFRNGGRELKTYAFYSFNYLEAFAESGDEFKRIIDAGIQRGWLEKTNGSTFRKIKPDFFVRLTADGNQHCEQLINESGLELLSEDIRPLGGKSILLINTETDNIWAKLISDKLMARGANVITHGIGINATNNSSLASIRASIRNVDFVLLLKSAHADSLRLWGDLLAATVEEEDRISAKKPLFFVLMTDDSDINQYYHLKFRDSRIKDIRILPHQENLFLQIFGALNERPRLRKQQDSAEEEKQQPVYKQRTKLIPEKFQWPQLDLTPAEEQWLNHIYSKFRKGERVDIAKEEPLFWKNFGAEERPTELGPLLVHNQQIKLLGIWTIDPKSPIFQMFDDLIWGIRDLFQTQGGMEKISSDQFRELLPQASFTELCNIGDLMYQYLFFNGWEGNDERFSYSFSAKARDIIRFYPGIEAFVQEEARKHGYTEFEEKFELPDVDLYEYNLEKTESIRNLSRIELSDLPREMVLGVQNLATDLVKIIHRLPDQLGRMIGIFAPWGRGKTVLINEIIKQINQFSNTDTSSESSGNADSGTDTSRNKHYHIISFHAWKYQDTPASWAYLYECFADAYYRKPKKLLELWGWAKYLGRILRLNAHRTRLIPLFKLIGILTIVTLSVWILVGISLSNLWAYQTEIKLVGGMTIVTLALALFDRIFKMYRTKAIDIIIRFTGRTSFKSEMGLQAEIQKELEILLKAWVGRKRKAEERILLIVEDIDRCSEDKVLHTIDGLRVMLENQEVANKVIIVCAVDQRMLSRAIQSKYKDLMHKADFGLKETAQAETSVLHQNEDESEPELPQPSEMQVLINEYIDKLFILAIKLEKLDAQQREELMEVFIGETTDELVDTPITDNTFTTSVEFASQTEEPVKKLTPTETDFDVAPSISSNKSETEAKAESNSRRTSASEIKFEPFTSVEKKQVIAAAAAWEGATPRQLRIFYYRYLLAKNMLIKDYARRGKNNIWKNKPYADYLPESIVYYMKMHQPEAIHNKRMHIMQNEQNREVEFAFGNRDLVKAEDYSRLLAILEIVIAY